METTASPSCSDRRLGRPASLLLTFFIFLVLAFFNTYSSTSALASAAGWAMTAFEAIMAFLIFRSGKPSRWRAVLFISFALLMTPAFIAGLLETRGSMQLSGKDVFLNETPFCHIVIPMAIIPELLNGTVIFPARITNHFASIYSMLVIWITATLLLGRGWCSWVCFYGGWDEGASRLAKKERLRIDPASDAYRYFSFAMLMLVVLGSLASLSAIYCEWLCPFKMVTEYSEVTNFISLLAFIMMIFGFFGITLILPFLTKKRFQCTAFCPFGAFQSLSGRLSPYRIRIDAGKCSSCMACVRACPVNAIRPQDIEAKTGKTAITCSLCGQCLSSCPKGAISYAFAWEKRCSAREGVFRKLSHRLAQGGGRLRLFLAAAALTLDELLSPRALFSASAIIMGSVVGGGFGIGSVQRLLNLILHGSFLLK